MAGKAKRAAAHKKKMSDKRAGKAAKRALYASMRGTSKKNKKRNSKGRFNNFSATKHKHLMEKCGNTGCPKCGMDWRLTSFLQTLKKRAA